MRSNSGLERFQRPSVSHSNLSATRFRADIDVNALKRLRPAGHSRKDRSGISIGKIEANILYCAAEVMYSATSTELQ